MITLQLGQCGQQLGCSFFQTLATELAAQDYGRAGVEQWFRPLNRADSWAPGSTHSHAARAVLIDMEPKVVNAVKHVARSKGGWWSYPAKGSLCMDSGAGNNWANGYHGYGPSVREAALDLVRREVEACDVLDGFLLLQSMAGGTGAGLGTYVATALRDEYPATHMLNCCVWPYESGEVIVQSYNTLLTLSHLNSVSDGIITLENDALHRCCTRLMNIPRPSFGDMNAVAAQALCAALLPSTARPATPQSVPAAHTGSNRHLTSAPGRRLSTSAPPRNPHPNSPTSAAAAVVSAAATAYSTKSAAASRPVHLLPDLITHLCSHPMYRMLSLRALPQVPTSSIDFTTFTWPAITKRLRQMLITGSPLEEGLDWGVTTSSSPPHNNNNSPGTPASNSPGGAVSPRVSHAHSSLNKSLSSWVVLRGQGSGTVDVSQLFGDPALYPWWAVDPLLVSSHPAPFAKCAMSAATLSNDQSCVAPMERMQDRAHAMLASRAYVHQYEHYGMSVHDFEECFAQVEEISERYRML